MTFSSPMPVRLPLPQARISNRKYCVVTGDRKSIHLRSGFVALEPVTGMVPFQVPCTVQVTLSVLVDTLICSRSRLQLGKVQMRLYLEEVPPSFHS